MSEGLPRGRSDGKRVCRQCRRLRSDPWSRKTPWRRERCLRGTTDGWAACPSTLGAPERPRPALRPWPRASESPQALGRPPPPQWRSKPSGALASTPVCGNLEKSESGGQCLRGRRKCVLLFTFTLIFLMIPPEVNLSSPQGRPLRCRSPLLSLPFCLLPLHPAAFEAVTDALRRVPAWTVCSAGSSQHLAPASTSGASAPLPSVQFQPLLCPVRV